MRHAVNHLSGALALAGYNTADVTCLLLLPASLLTEPRLSSAMHSVFQAEADEFNF